MLSSSSITSLTFSTGHLNLTTQVASTPAAPAACPLPPLTPPWGSDQELDALAATWGGPRPGVADALVVACSRVGAAWRRQVAAVAGVPPHSAADLLAADMAAARCTPAPVPGTTSEQHHTVLGVWDCLAKSAAKAAAAAMPTRCAVLLSCPPPAWPLQPPCSQPLHRLAQVLSREGMLDFALYAAGGQMMRAAHAVSTAAGASPHDAPNPTHCQVHQGPAGQEGGGDEHPAVAAAPVGQLLLGRCGVETWQRQGNIITPDGGTLECDIHWAHFLVDGVQQVSVKLPPFYASPDATVLWAT